MSNTDTSITETISSPIVTTTTIVTETTVIEVAPATESGSAAESAAVIAALRAYVVEEFLPGTDPERIETGMDLLNSGIIDSLGLLKLIAWLETRFEVGIDDTDLDPENFRSLATIAEFVTRPRPTIDAS